MIAEIRKKIVEIDEDAIALTEKALAEGVPAEELLNEGIIKALSEIGEKFEAGEYFLPELQWGAELANKCIALVQPHIPAGKLEVAGTVVMATVSGDLHSIGKDLVTTQLKLAGFEVHDLGIDQTTMAIIRKARDVRANIIGLSALMSVSMPYQPELINYLQSMGIRDQFKVIVGGGPTTQAWADMIGADGWADSAPAAVKLAKKLVAAQKEAVR